MCSFQYFPEREISLLKAEAAASNLKPTSPELTDVSSFKATSQTCLNELHDNKSHL